MRLRKPYKMLSGAIIFFILLQFSALVADAQFREVYYGGNEGSYNYLNGMSFVTPATGYVAFTRSVAFTQDSGKTYTHKTVGYENTDFNGYSVNLTFGFLTNGVHAFSIDSLLIYGDFGGEPSILFSANRGQTWRLVYHQPPNINLGYTNTIIDLKFPTSGSARSNGIAISDKSILYSPDRGQHWQIQKRLPDFSTTRFYKLSMVDVNAFAIAGDAMFASGDAGITWGNVQLPPNPNGYLNFKNVSFLNAQEGYVTHEGDQRVYRTGNRGISWQSMNNPAVCPIIGRDMYFSSLGTGYIGLLEGYEVYKTIDSGATWEPCKKNSTYQLNSFGIQRLYFYNSQVGWAMAAGSQYLLMTTNGGGVTLPKSLFSIDTINLAATGVVKLVNSSNSAYSFKWYRNRVLISTSRNTSYIHDIHNPQDSIVLVVQNSSGEIDSLLKIQRFTLPPNTPIVYSYSPLIGGQGSSITIRGINFTGATAVSFGGVAANSFVVNSTNTITAQVGSGASGDVSVTTPVATVSKAGFSYISQPIINTFLPLIAGTDSVVTITGSNFLDVTAVRFGGIDAKSFVVNDISGITAIVGTGATGNIEITNQYGTGSITGFTYVPPPSITSFTPTSGFSSTLITITGTNFINVTSVSIGNVLYTTPRITVVSATQIEVVLNNIADIGLLEIVVKTPGGTASKNGLTFCKAPTFSGVSPIIGTAGMPITISGTNFSCVTAVTIGGVPAASYTVVSTTQIIAILGEGAGGSINVSNIAGTNNGNIVFKFTTCPVITGYLPGSGSVGSLVRINGGGFSQLPSNNIVYCGQVKAKVIASTKNYITIQIPNAITNESLSVTNLETNLTGYSDLPFRVSFPGEPDAFNNNSYGQPVNIPARDNILSVIPGDIDGDSKPDMIVTYNNDSVISIYRNISTGIIVAFAPRVDISVIQGLKYIVLGDFNNDGTLDIIGTQGIMSSPVLVVIKNKSIPANISFDPATVLSGSFANLPLLTLGDFNFDGKIDIAGACTNCAEGSTNGMVLKVTVFRNSSTADSLSVAYGAGYRTPDVLHGSSYPLFTNMTVRDLNRDNRPDIVLGTTWGLFALFKNVSSPSIRLESEIIGEPVPSGYRRSTVQISDFQNDGLPDVITENSQHTNTGNFKFSSVITPRGDLGDVADLNGDRKPDYIKATKTGDSSINIAKNISNNNDIAFAPPFQFPVNATNYIFSQVADLDADGKPEILYINRSINAISILKNKIGSAIFCPGGNVTLLSSITNGTTFQWQQNTGSGFANIANNINFSGVNTNSLQLSNIPASWKNYQYRCIVNGTNSEVYALQSYNTWTGLVSTAWENPANWGCNAVPDSNSDVIISGGSVEINSNTSIRTLSINPDVSLTIAAGYNLTILH